MSLPFVWQSVCLPGSHKIYKTLAQKYICIYVSLPRYIESCLLLLVVGFLPACCEKFCSFCCQTFVVGNSRCFWPLVVWAGVRVCVCVCVTRSAIGPITLNECFADDREEREGTHPPLIEPQGREGRPALLDKRQGFGQDSAWIRQVIHML